MIKRTCNKCLAYYWAVGVGGGKHEIVCALGYKLSGQHIAHPLEECPKPLTHNQYPLNRKHREGSES